MDDKDERRLSRVETGQRALFRAQREMHGRVEKLEQARRSEGRTEGRVVALISAIAVVLAAIIAVIGQIIVRGVP